MDADAAIANGIAQAVAAAHAVFDTPRAPLDYEPTGRDEAAAAVETLGQRFDGGGGTLTEIIENARAAAQILSGDRLQGLSEIVQNADDAEAVTVRFLLRDDELLIAHDGRPLVLKDVHALAAPWLTTKRDDASAVGRFGIGLMTLHALAETLEVHSGDYHIRFGDPSLTTIATPELPDGFAAGHETVLRLPLAHNALEPSALMDWASGWEDSGLLFLSHVSEVMFSAGSSCRTLRLTWEELGGTRWEGLNEVAAVRRRTATASDGRSWIVHAAEIPSPRGLHRAHKATHATTPVAVALGLVEEPEGVLYAGLPVVHVDLPIRASAQFDPIASRQGLADTKWNRALADLVADLWTHAVFDLFDIDPRRAWQVIPLSRDASTEVGVVAYLEQLLIERAHRVIAEELAFAVDGTEHWVGDLAVEVVELEGLLTPEEVAQLAGLAAAMPTAIRDDNDRWRVVLDDWRAAGVQLAPLVDVLRALALLSDESREPDRTVNLAAAALGVGLGDQLADTPFVVAEDGSRLRPPSATSIVCLIDQPDGLPTTLGIGRPLHAAHVASTPSADTVLGWLRERGALIDSSDERAALTRIAAGGRAGHRLTAPLTDEQLLALRDALERLGQGDWSKLGPGIGLAVALDGLRHDSRGRHTPVHVCPAQAYLPKSIDRDRESFAVAADTTPDITWLASRYSTVLRSSLGRAGLGPQKFLHLLGAETAPRLTHHPQLHRRYADSRLGLAAHISGGPPQRAQALAELGATYSLEDTCSPDLDRVLHHIAKDRKATRRRTRARAIAATLGRSWSSLSESAVVTAADDYHTWRSKGPVRAWWLWQAGFIPWLDDASATPSPPSHLRIKTPATVAVHGVDADGYLHPSFSGLRRDVLAALGVAGEPSTGDLCNRLRQLRDEAQVSAEVSAECAVIYRALAERLEAPAHVPGDLTLTRLRQVFSNGAGLVLTAHGWQPPAAALDGPPIFGDLRAFVPAVPGTDRLWRQLQVRRPLLDDCVDVLADIGRTKLQPTTGEQTIILETLREISRLLDATPPTTTQSRRLSRVPLWTSQGWWATRPVYAVDDPALGAGLSERVPVWRPGGDTAQFRRVLDPLKVTEVPASAGVIIVTKDAEMDEEATSLFAESVAFLHEDLARNDPKSEAALRVGWSRLGTLDVYIAAQLTVRVDSIPGDAGVVNVTAKADPSAGRLYLTDAALLARVDGGGRAVAGLFDADHRSIAQAWLAAVELARSDREVVRLELAAERQAAQEAENQAAIEAQLRELQKQSKERRGSRRKKPAVPTRTETPATVGKGSPAPPPTPAPAPPPPPRVLVNPEMLQVTDPDGKIVAPAAGDADGSRRRKDARKLREPRPSTGAPQGNSPLRDYSDLDRETVGLELARKVLGSDADAMIDLRAQRGVGADAMDELRQFFELKVYAGAEPDQIRLEDSEIRRAMSTPDFFVVVVSNVEGADAKPKVRVIADPLTQLRMVESSEVRFSGIRASHSLVYDLAPSTAAISSDEVAG
jgi:hypothetical protein